MQPNGRRPVHVVYGGAQLFRSDLCQKLGGVALRSLAEYAPDPSTLSEATGMDPAVASAIHGRVREKLEREPVEDYRIDFEDGYGYRSDAEEDGHATAAAEQAAQAARQQLLPPFFGIRIKPLARATKKRSLRTLDLFLVQFREACGPAQPGNFVITLPKITEPAEVRTLVESLELVENLRPGPRNSIELMMETPQALRRLPELIEAASGRSVGVHFGPYDYTSSLGIAAPHQSLNHPACDFARNMMQVMLKGYRVSLSDGPTTLLPIAPHRGEGLMEAQRAENRTTVHQAWRLHYDNVRRALGNGFYQGWDLHPAQLPMRYAAMHAFFEEGRKDASARMTNFVSAAAQATRIGATFDDAATGQGLLNFFLRGMHCGAFPEGDIPALTGLSPQELETRSFVKILEMRRTG